MSQEFRSIFADEFRELLAVKRALGFKYLSEEGAFLRIDAFLASHSVDTKEISRELCEEWCRKRSYESPSNHGSRVSQMRVFCRYLNELRKECINPEKRSFFGKIFEPESPLYSDEFSKVIGEDASKLPAHS